jgi:hypothetical protein
MEQIESAFGLSDLVHPPLVQAEVSVEPGG